MKRIIGFFMLLLVLVQFQTFGHNVDQSYIFLRVDADSINGRVEITTKDLNKALNLNLQKGLSASEVTPYLPAIQDHIRKNVHFSIGEEPIEYSFNNVSILNTNFGEFVQIGFRLNSSEKISDYLNVDYEILIDESTTHRGLLVVEYNPDADIYENEALPSLIFSPGDTHKTLDLNDTLIWDALGVMIRSGVWHIWIGIDHILFLVALLMPSVLILSKRSNTNIKSNPTIEYSDRRPVDDFKFAFVNVVKIVTCFTVAHSITLSAAALELITLPSSLVETVIAFSIAVAAYHNIKPLYYGPEWIIALAFGLFHGFGFASVLGETGLGGDFLSLSLLGFNIGVELGQIAIIIVVFPLFYLIRKSYMYPYFMKFGSGALILIAIHWMIERIFGIELQIIESIKSLIL